MAECNDNAVSTDGMPDMQQFFVGIWDRERVSKAIDNHIAYQRTDALDEGVEEDDIFADYNEAYSECWWEHLIEWMRIGTDIKVGDLMTSEWHDDSVIMLMSHPGELRDECWLMNGELLSTYDLIKDDVEEWL